MKKLKLFFAGALLAIAGNAMAQDSVTLTANEAADKNGGWTLQVQAPEDIAGWQMLVNLPEGLTIPVKEEKTIGGAAFTIYDVTLPYANDKYAVVGTPADAGIFLFCFPLSDTYTAADIANVIAKGSESNLCTIKLEGTYEGNPTCVITNIATSDAAGVSTTVGNVDLEAIHPTGDANYDFRVNGLDIQETINCSANGTFKASADVNNDGVVNGLDIQNVINYSAK